MSIGASLRVANLGSRDSNPGGKISKTIATARHSNPKGEPFAVISESPWAQKRGIYLDPNLQQWSVDSIDLVRLTASAKPLKVSCKTVTKQRKQNSHFKLKKNTIDSENKVRSRMQTAPLSSRSNTSSNSSKSINYKRPKAPLGEAKAVQSVYHQMSFKDRLSAKKQDEIRKSILTLQTATETDSSERERLEMRSNEIETRITNKHAFMAVVEQDIVELEAEIAEEDAVREELEREVAEL